MGKPYSGCPGSEWHPCPLSISMSVGRIPEIFGVGWAQHWKEIFFVSEISADPQKRPYGAKGVSRRPKNGQKVFVKFDTKLLKTRNRAKKTRTRVSEDFLRSTATTPKFGGRQKFLRVWAYFWKFWVDGFFSKIFLVTFYCCFFQIFFKNCQKMKGRKGRFDKTFLKTCYLRSLDTIWYILYYIIGFMIFCD
jgi:hypothetical protein